MKPRRILALVIAVAICSPSWLAAAEGSGKKAGNGGVAEEPALTCPVSGNPASKTAFVEYHGGRVFLCCEGCKAKFENETAKYATKANYQLVQTGQAKQVACPFTGRPLDPALSITVAGVKVGFCCNACKSKMAKATADEQFELAFGSTTFEKAFKVEAKKKEKKEKKQS